MTRQVPAGRIEEAEREQLRRYGALEAHLLGEAERLGHLLGAVREARSAWLARALEARGLPADGAYSVDDESGELYRIAEEG